MTRLRVGSATDTGRVRSNNEDAKLVGDNLYAVADGMGGHQGGEVAAALAIETVSERVHEATPEALVDGVRIANRAIYERAASDPELAGMGTTLCAATLIDRDDGSQQMVIVNVGDSRVYLYREDELTQITVDHSLVEDLRREGRLTDEEAAIHPHRNVITRVLGVEPDVEVDEFGVVPHVGDRYLLCSDGLFNEVSVDGIAATLRRLDDPNEAVADLVRQANEEGGRDNITCVLVDVVDDGDAAIGNGAHGSAAVVDADHDVAGFTSAAPSSAPLRGDVAVAEPADDVGTTTDVDGRLATTTTERVKPRRFTWRVALFVILVLAVLGVAAAAVGYYARNTYYVGVRNGQVTIFKGRPGGVLWFDPTVAETTRASLAAIPAEYRDEIRSGVDAKSIGDARNYIARLQAIAKQRGQATPTPTTTAPPRPLPGSHPTVTPGAPATTPR